MKIKRICKWCGKEFELHPSAIKQGRGTFCSRKCMGKSHSEHQIGKDNPSWKPKIKCICKQCGKEFEVTPSVIKQGGGKFCSRECYHKSLKIRTKCMCQQCGAEFFLYPYEIKNGRGKFCTTKCYGKWKSEHITGKSNPSWKGGKIEHICEICGIKFFEWPSRKRRGRAKVCSHKCQVKWQSKNRSGKNNPQWRGGISFKPYCPKFNNEFKEYIRDKFGRICFLCDKNEEENEQKLSVHHVNYNKNCGCDDDETCQFVPLCRSCNSKVNKNREEWEAKIKAMMKNKLNGWYI